MKVTIQYQPENEEQTAKQILSKVQSVLCGAKVREKHNHPPYKHIYITHKNVDEPTK